MTDTLETRCRLLAILTGCPTHDKLSVSGMHSMLVVPQHDAVRGSPGEMRARLWRGGSALPQDRQR